MTQPGRLQIQLIEEPAEWYSWRGSPELLAHVARVALSVVERDGQCAGSLIIDISVDDDHERFSSAKDFLEGATREGLDRFTNIQIEARSQDQEVDIAFVRKTRTEAESVQPEDVENPAALERRANVLVRARAQNSEAALEALKTVNAAVTRGRVKTMENVNFRLRVVDWMTKILAAVFIVGLSNLLTRTISYILGVSSFVAEMLGWIGIGVGFVAVLVSWLWVFPAIEVAPFGQTRRARVLKWGIGIATALLATVIGKAVLGD